MKIYGILNGLFYILYGLYGLLLPHHIAEHMMGWTPDVLGLHQIRAMWMASLGMGVICILIALRGRFGTLINLTKAIIFITLCFMAGRLLGVALDGSSVVQTYKEISFEIFWSAAGWFILSRIKTPANQP